MKTLNILFTIMFAFFTLIVIGQNREKRTIESFDKLDVFGNIEVVMKEGSKEKIEISTLNVSTSEVKTQISDKLLKIRMNSNLFKEDVKVKVILTYKEIREIKANASTEIIIKDPIKGDKLFLDATSGAIIQLKVDLNAIEINAYQGAHIDITGKCKLQESYINTGGVLSGSNFESDEVFIKMNTGGKAEIIVNNKLDAKINTKASLNYFGTPQDENIKTTLGGEIIAWDK